MTVDRCPGIVHAVPARDGLLARVRIPGGLIACFQWEAVAELARACGDGNIHITSRANIQLRGLRAEELPRLAQGLALVGLLPSEQHDRVRNILASPFAGIACNELLDMRPLVRALDDGLLAEPLLAALPAKFCFVLDGGGYPLESIAADLRLRVAGSDARDLCLQLLVGDRESGRRIKPEDGAAALLEAARLADGKRCVTEAAPLAPPPALPMPLGVLDAHLPELANLVPVVPLGKLSAEQMESCASVLQRYGGELRLAPWKGIVLGGMPRNALTEIAAELQRAGLELDASGGYTKVAACVGTEGCGLALADVRRDAATLAQRLERMKHVAGKTAPMIWLTACGRRCGMSRGAGIALVAGVDGYDVLLDGALVAAATTADRAIDLSLSLYEAQAVRK